MNSQCQKMNLTNQYKEGVNDQESNDSCCKTVGCLCSELKQVT